MKSWKIRLLPSIAPTSPSISGGWSQSGRVRVAGSLGGGSEDKPSVQWFVVKNCLMF